MLFITHDMGVVAEIADEVAVMRYRRASSSRARSTRSSTTPQAPLHAAAARLRR